jgi:hypothetical protein
VAKYVIERVNGLEWPFRYRAYCYTEIPWNPLGLGPYKKTITLTITRKGARMAVRSYQRSEVKARKLLENPQVVWTEDVDL